MHNGALLQSALILRQSLHVRGGLIQLLSLEKVTKLASID